MLRFALLIAWLRAPCGTAYVRVPLSVDSGTILRAQDFSAQVYWTDEVKVARVRTPEDDMLLMVVMDMVGDLALSIRRDTLWPTD